MRYQLSITCLHVFFAMLKMFFISPPKWSRFLLCGAYHISAERIIFLQHCVNSTPKMSCVGKGELNDFKEGFIHLTVLHFINNPIFFHFFL